MKQQRSISPFYFPTTVVFVDDSRDYLANLSLQLDSRLAFRLLDAPCQALAAINGSPESELLNERYFAPYRYREEMSSHHHVIDLDLDKIHREVHNEYRFQQVSVVIVDYDMPEMNGLEFCAKIKDPAIKKILLTGKADDKIAVDAFNEGVIDRFITKNNEKVMAILDRAISEMQQAYFRDLERMLVDALAIGTHRFLSDSRFVEEFKAISERLQIVEHYVSTTPEGILMFDANAVPYLLVVQTEDHLMAQHEIAFDQGAPDELLAALRSNEVVPHFWRSGGSYSSDCADWQSYLFPAHELQGARQWFYYAIIKNPPGFKLDTVLSYNEYLDMLDEEGSAPILGQRDTDGCYGRAFR